MPPRADTEATLRLALERFDAGDVQGLDALLAPDFLHTGNPLFHRESEDERFASLAARMASFDEHDITTTSRLVNLEQVTETVFVATMVLHAESSSRKGFSMLAGVLISFDELGRIDHIHTHDTPAAARVAAGEGCCEAHRLRVAARAADAA